MKRMLRGKKGQLSGLIDNIGSFIQGIISVLPKPVLFILFLFIMVTAAFILSLIFSAFGYYCNSADEPVKLNANFLTGISLIGQIPDPADLGKEALTMEEAGISVATTQVTYCSREFQSGTVYRDDGTAYNFSTQTWFYDGRFCTDCTTVNVCDTVGNCERRCEADVFRLEDSEKGILQRTFCGGFGCEPPKHYQYSQAQNLYLCSDETCSGITLGQKWDELLQSKGATLVYPDPSDALNPSSDQFVGITCSDLRPKLALYGIDIFTYSYWLIITLLIFLFWGIRHLKRS